MKLKPISATELNVELRRDDILPIDFRDHFKMTIEQASKFASSPFFWFIPDTKQMVVAAASDNIHQLTPYKKEEWEGNDLLFWFSNVHPDDRNFVMSAVAMSATISEMPPIERGNMMRSNIYCRMMNAQNIYRWVLMQFPERLYSKEEKVISCLVMMTDLSHLTNNFKRMMTVLDTSNNETQFFAALVDEQRLVSLSLPTISKRELQIMQLMVKGLNSPQIAKELFISYHTVENHKRNLRQKTNTKTSAELVGFVINNNLM